MAKADRLERMDERRLELEQEYREALVTALHETAAGRWGLFGHNRDHRSRAGLAATLSGLQETADAIDAIRKRFGMDPFALHPEFLASRGPAGPNAPGELRQAMAWLEKLGASAVAAPAP